MRGPEPNHDTFLSMVTDWLRSDQIPPKTTQTAPKYTQGPGFQVYSHFVRVPRLCEKSRKVYPLRFSLPPPPPPGV